MSDWKPIDTCPKDKRVLFWWRPANNNPFAECAVTGSLPTDPKLREKWWNDQTGKYQDIWHVTLWTEMPNEPEDVHKRKEKFLEDYKAGRI